MNFFEQQDRSRRATRMLVGLFSAAVLFICTCIYFAVMLSINTTSLRWTVFGDRACQPIVAQISSPTYARAIDSTLSIPIDPPTNAPVPQVKRRFSLGSGRSNGVSRFGNNSTRPTSYRRDRYDRTSVYSGSNAAPLSASGVPCRPQTVWGDLRVFFWTLLGTTAVVGGTSWWKFNQLRAGGAVIAAELGGMRVLPESASPEERQLLNIVEEVAIAATIAVPPVYVLHHEDGINAFAAGFTINDAVIGVTRGSLERLTRDELQGVIAHEFSHILNGDMAMNIRLMGMLHGILSLHLIGRILMYTGSSRNNPLWTLGLCLQAIGFSGFLSGRMIQSGISRQREFLADASAVQFTRNPDGIASALEKIGGYSSQIDSPHAETASHMFFSPALDLSLFEGLFATHPPLDRRIAIVRGVGRKLGTKIVVNGQALPNFQPISQIGTIGFAGAEAATSTAETSSSGVYGALAHTYTLLLDSPKATLRERDLATEQLAYLATVEEPAVIEQIATLRSVVAVLPPQQRLATLDRQLSQLRDPEHASRLMKCANGLMEILPPDDWHTPIVYLILHHRLTAIADTPPEIYHSIADVWAEVINVLGTLARLSSTTPQDTDYAFATGLFRLPNALASSAKLPPEIYWQEFHTDLLKIASAAPKVKQSLMAACLETLTNRQQIPADGVDLMRSIAILLDAPIPPILDRLKIAELDRLPVPQPV
jgi:Zn-dependent protease with chaperone function